jgi:hypothetical protein
MNIKYSPVKERSINYQNFLALLEGKKPKSDLFQVIYRERIVCRKIETPLGG